MPPFDLDAICNPPETTWHAHDPQPIYRFDDYIALYERHCRASGHPFDPTRFDPKVYKYEPVHETVESQSQHFRCEPFGDLLRVRLNVDEDTETVKIAVNTALSELFASSWARGVKPSLNDLVLTFKKLGADDTFLKQIIKKHGQIQSVCKKFDIDRAFKPKSRPKTTATKKVKEVVKAVDEENDEDEREEEEEEFEGLDVEENEDDEDLACQDGDDEEFVDDMDED